MLLGKAFLGLDACKRSLKGLVDRSGPLRSLMGLTEVDKGLFQVKRVEGGELYQSFLIQQDVVCFEWELMNVYGTSHEDRKMDFVSELRDKMSNALFPILLWGRL